MTFWNLETAARNNPKLLTAGKDAVCLWTMCALYSAEQLTDGFVPDDEVKRICDVWKLDKGTLARCLASVVPGRGPMLDGVSGGVRVHDWHEYNPDAAKIKRLAADRRRAGRKGAESRYSSKCYEQVPDSKCQMASDPSNGLVGRLVGKDLDQEGGSGGKVTAEQIKAVYCSAYLARNGTHPTDADHGPSRVAAWANKHGIPIADLDPAIRRIVSEAKGLSLLPVVWDQWKAKPATRLVVPTTEKLTLLSGDPWDGGAKVEHDA